MTVEDLDRMSPPDATAWRSATSVADLGQLTAAWLEGDLESHPAWEPGEGPEEETHDLIPVLARLNSAGFLTDSSQPGLALYDDEYEEAWRQRPAVSGRIADPDLAARLTTAAEAAGLIVATAEAVHVTTCNGQAVTWFGGVQPVEDLELEWRDHISDSAWRELVAAPQYAFIDPQYGPGTRLWDALRGALTA